MAVLYVVGTNVKEKVLELQKKDFINTYVSRETLSHFDEIKATDEQKSEAMKDIMSICDAVIFVGNKSVSTREELAFAELIGMEVIKIENTSNT